MGPLKNIKVLEFSGIGPGPYCGMLLADMGADVIRISRKGSEGLENKFDIKYVFPNHKRVTIDPNNLDLKNFLIPHQ